jgi:GTP-binding protein HflX
MKEQNIQQSAILVGIAKNSSEIPKCEESLAELERLLETAGGQTFAKVIQIKESFDARTCIGSGKVKEISELCEANSIELIVFDFELSPAQIRNLEDDTKARVIDRTMLILDIFALHAVSGEGKMQVELAQLKYTIPRLIGKGAELSRQEGRIGTRGPGESKLETDRRHVHRRIASIEAQIAEMEKNRMVMRNARDRSRMSKIAIVGYTNAGKSTLLNFLTDAGVLSEDKLFATLDPTTRRLTLPEGETVLLTDTVGLIRNLPHHLIKAFKSTLDEASYADILMIVIDHSDPSHEDHLKVTLDLLSELNAADKPIIYVYNKCDRSELPRPTRDASVYISAKTGEGIDSLLALLERTVKEGAKSVELLLPYDKSSFLNGLYSVSTVDNLEYKDEGISLVATFKEGVPHIYEQFIVSKKEGSDA